MPKHFSAGAVRDALSSPRLGPWRVVADPIDAWMHRPPRSRRFYVASAAVYAFLSYLAVQLVYDWELDRAGLHAKGFHPETVFRNTYAVHFVSFAVWLAIALVTGALVHRIQRTLAVAFDDARRRSEELALISRVGAAMAEPLPASRLARDFLRLVRTRLAPTMTMEVAAFDEESQSYSTLAVDGPGSGSDVPVPVSSLPRALRDHLLGPFEPIVVPVVASRLDISAAIAVWPQLAAARSLCLMPLVSRERPVGVLIQWDEIAGTIDRELVNLLTSLGQYLAGALDSAALVAGAQARADREARLNAELQRLNKAKSDFVSIVAHEFRTPLTGIQGFSEIIRDYEITLAEAKEYAADINADAQRLTRMINSQLDLDRLQSGQIDIRVESVQLNDLVTSVVELTRPTTADHHILLDLDSALPPIKADRDRLVQVVTNLVSNAVKYSPDGGEIAIATRREGATVHLTVRDCGVGIPPAALERIFEPYTRIESEEDERQSGTGLGLAIVRQIVTLHGGRVWAESGPDTGSTFHVTLPIERT